MEEKKTPTVWESKMNKAERPQVHRIGKLIAQRCSSCGKSGQEYYLRIETQKDRTILYLCVECEGHLTATMINAYLHVRSGRWPHDAYRGTLPKGEEFEKRGV